jgi:glutamate 5-kinase
VRGIEGDFESDAAVEIVDESGEVFAKGLCGYTSALLRTHRGRQTAELPDGLPHEVVHRDDLVVLASSTANTAEKHGENTLT